MREIKFRVWDKESKYFCVNPEDYNMDYFMYMDGELYWDGYPVDKGRYEIMQFTGLKDKNGKEIYEGDILKIPHYTKYRLSYVNDLSYQGLFLIRHNQGGEFWNDISNKNQVEVIGNIYENPDLCPSGDLIADKQNPQDNNNDKIVAD